jgi:RNA polymerase sigma-70 factor (ECF subfamily)
MAGRGWYVAWRGLDQSPASADRLRRAVRINRSESRAPTRFCDHLLVPDERDDVELVELVAEDDTDALRVLYERYGSIVFGMAQRLLGDRQLAEECTQDVFVALWRSAAKYEPKRAQVSTWLIGIAKYRAIDLVRRRTARPADPYAEVWQADESPDSAELVAASDEAQRVAAAVAALPPPQREALTLAYFEGLSHSEIAARLSVPLGTVKGRIRMALDRLRELAPEFSLHAEWER